MHGRLSKVFFFLCTHYIPMAATHHLCSLLPIPNTMLPSPMPPVSQSTNPCLSLSLTVCSSFNVNPPMHGHPPHLSYSSSSYSAIVPTTGNLINLHTHALHAIHAIVIRSTLPPPSIPTMTGPSLPPTVTTLARSEPLTPTFC